MNDTDLYPMLFWLAVIAALIYSIDRKKSAADRDPHGLLTAAQKRCSTILYAIKSAIVHSIKNVISLPRSENR
jgi:hypothetical protein